MNTVFTQEQLNTLLSLKKQFESRCREISEIFEPLGRDYHYCQNKNADWKVLDWSDTNIVCSGEIETNFCMGEGEWFSVSFPFDYLTKSDDELKQILQSELDERKKEEEEEQQKKTNERIREKELAELERLKQKYEKKY